MLEKTDVGGLMRTRKKIYLKAAELIASHRQDFSCCAIDQAVCDLKGGTLETCTTERTLYAHTMSPDPGGLEYGTDRSRVLRGGDIAQAVCDIKYTQFQDNFRDFRVWLLLMMATVEADLDEPLKND